MWVVKKSREKVGSEICKFKNTFITCMIWLERHPPPNDPSLKNDGHSTVCHLSRFGRGATILDIVISEAKLLKLTQTLDYKIPLSQFRAKSRSQISRGHFCFTLDKLREIGTGKEGLLVVLRRPTQCDALGRPSKVESVNELFSLIHQILFECWCPVRRSSCARETLTKLLLVFFIHCT